MDSTTIIGIATVLILVYSLIKWNSSYWQRRGVPFLKPRSPFANILGIGKRSHTSESFTNYYKQMKGSGPFFGLQGSRTIMATDIDFIKHILIKDFNHFVDRGMFHNEKSDPLSAHLFSIEGQRWRSLRAKLSPTFTSGKMKFMYPTIVDVANEFKSTVDSILKENNGSADIEIKDILARFTTDVIGVCAFGIECNSLKDPEVEFRKRGKEVFTIERKSFMKFMFAFFFPKFAKFIGLKTTKPEVEEFFMGIVKQTVNYRKTNNVNRNDFMDLLIKLMKNNENDGLSINEVSAQAFLFFLAGFETSSTAMTFALHELAKNPQIQLKARQEIKSVLDKHNGELSYEAMLEMTYIDQIIYGMFKYIFFFIYYLHFFSFYRIFKKVSTCFSFGPHCNQYLYCSWN